MTDTAAATCASGSTRRDAVVMSSCVSSSIDSLEVLRELRVGALGENRDAREAEHNEG